MLRSAISLFCTLIALVIGISAAFQKTETSKLAESDVVDCTEFHPYSADPNHIWNRVHRRLLVRRDAQGKVWGCDEVDPLLWRETQHVLAGPAYRETVALLDEFSRTHSEQLIRDPVRRAMFQRDLWAVFDWLAQPTDEHSRERAELEKRLAMIIKAVALKGSEIQQLPDNYRQLRGAFLSASTNDGFALPDSSDDWLMIGRDDAGPVAPIHSFPFSRSLFLVYMKLPPGGMNAPAYLESMRAYSRQHPPGEDCQIRPCNPPQFPVGTELALVRRALLVDTSGQPVISPVTESIQLRRYLKIPPGVGIDFNGEMQQVAEFLLSRRALLQGDLSLHRVGESESHFQVFSTHGTDSFERGEKTIEFPALRGCHGCHQGVGVRSFTTYSRAQFEINHLFIPVHTGTESQESAAAITYLQSRDSWKLLQRLMK
jgi:hypothetical protein